MAAEFPNSSKEFTTKQDGVDKIYASHVNDIQDEVMALEQALLGEILDGNVQYVKKAASSTDNAIPRFDGTDGKKLQNSGVTVDDSNNIKVGTAPVPTSVTSSTDNAVVRFDGTGGNKIQNSGVIINDSGQLSGNGLDGWIYDTDTWTYVSATSFKIAGKNVSYRFPNGTKIKLVQSGTTKYFYVTAATFSTDTTVTITGGSDYSLASGTISGQAYSYAVAPQGFPQWFFYTPTTYTGWSALPSGTYIFKIIGRLCIYPVDMSAGTSNGTSAELSIPVVASSGMTKGGVNGYAVDNGTTLTGASRWRITGADNKVQFYTNMATGAWTNSGTKRVGALIIYEF